MSELLVLRHATAGDGPGRDAPDHERELSLHGQSEARRMGRWLAEQGLPVQLALASTATRAVQTARLALESLGTDAPELMTEQRLYLAEPSTLAQTVVEHALDCERLLLVGHNPGLAQLVEGLMGQPLVADPASGALFPPATLARMELPGGWPSLGVGAARCLELVRVASLPADAP